jgi:hypothetical protein
MTTKELQSVINLALPSDYRDNEVVVVMPDDPTAIYSVQGIKFNKEQQTLEVLVA